MKEIREIFETVRTYCGMMFGENRAAKQLGSGAAKRNCHLEKKQLPSVVIPSDSEGIQPIKIERLVAYPSKSSLTREDLCYGKVAHDNNFDSPETVYSLLTTHHSLKRAAFTLAEVLITLGIIGVVAALTLPTLIQNHQKQVYVTQLKKAYSTLGNAFNKMAADEGVVDWNQTYCSSSFWVENNLEAAKANYNECLDRIAKQMKVIKYKHYGEQCNEAWCEFSSDPIDYNPTGGNPIMVTADGITYLFNCGSAYDYIVVDVNGTTKGPNKPGRDIFQFTAYKNKYDSSGHWSGSEFKNALYPDGSEHDYWKDCSATNLSTSCTAKVLIEGKMNY